MLKERSPTTTTPEQSCESIKTTLQQANSEVPTLTLGEVIEELQIEE